MEEIPYAPCQNCGCELAPTDDPDILECPNCGSYQYWAHGDWHFMKAEENEEGYDDIWTDDRPEVCTGCGSDMYPDCSYSCNRINN